VYVILRENKGIRFCDTSEEFLLSICLRDGVEGEDRSVERERIFTPALPRDFEMD
jgi:hypothetical protein